MLFYCLRKFSVDVYYHGPLYTSKLSTNNISLICSDFVGFYCVNKDHGVSHIAYVEIQKLNM